MSAAYMSDKASDQEEGRTMDNQGQGNRSVNKVGSILQQPNTDQKPLTGQHEQMIEYAREGQPDKAKLNKLQWFLLNCSGRDNKTSKVYTQVIMELVTRSPDQRNLMKEFASELRVPLLIRLLHNSTWDYHEKIPVVIFHLIENKSWTSEEVRVVIGEIVKASRNPIINVSTIGKLHIQSYLILTVLECILLTEKDMASQHCQPKDSTLKDTLGEIIVSMTHDQADKNGWTTLNNLAKDTILMLRKPRAVAVIMINSLVKCLLSQFQACTISVRKTRLLKILSFIGSEIITRMKHLPKFQVKVQSNSNPQICLICGQNRRTMHVIRLQTQMSYDLVFCSQCSITKSKFCAHSKHPGILDLLYVVICKKKLQFCSEYQTLQKIAYVSELVSHSGVSTKRRRKDIGELTRRMSAQEISHLDAGFSEQAICVLNYYYEGISLQSHLQDAFKCLVLESGDNSPQRRIKALSCLKYYLQLFQNNLLGVDSPLKSHIRTILEFRSKDLESEVRAKALQQIYKIFRIAHDWDWLKLIVSLTADQQMTIRRSALSYLQRCVGLAADVCPDKILVMVQQLLERIDDKSQLIRQDALETLRLLLVNRNSKDTLQKTILNLVGSTQSSWRPLTLKVLVRCCLNFGQQIHKELDTVFGQVVCSKVTTHQQAYFIDCVANTFPRMACLHLGRLTASLGRSLFGDFDTPVCQTNTCRLIAQTTSKVITRLVRNKELQRVQSEEVAQLCKSFLSNNVFMTQDQSLARHLLSIQVKVDVASRGYYSLQIYQLYCDRVVQLQHQQKPSAEDNQLMGRLLALLTQIVMSAKQVGSQWFSEETVANLYTYLLKYSNIGSQQVRTNAVWHLYRFWQSGHRIASRNPEQLSHLMDQIRDDDTISVLYRSILPKMVQYVNHVPNQQTIMARQMFTSTYLRFFDSDNTELRIVIAQIMDVLATTGQFPVHQCNHILFCYLCDPVPEVRQLSAKILESVNQEFLFSRFRQVMVTLVTFIQHRHGQLIWGVEESNGIFMKPLVRVISQAQRHLTKAQKRAKVTLVKKLAQVISSYNGELGSSQRQGRVIEYACMVTCNQSVFEVSQYREMVLCLSQFYSINSHKIERLIKSLLQEQKGMSGETQLTYEQVESSQTIPIRSPQDYTQKYISSYREIIVYSNKTQAISSIQKINVRQAGRTLVRIKQTINLMTNGKSAQQALRDIQLRGSQWVTITQQSRVKYINQLPSDLEAVYCFLTESKSQTKPSIANTLKDRKNAKNSTSFIREGRPINIGPQQTLRNKNSKSPSPSPGTWRQQRRCPRRRRSRIHFNQNDF